MKKCIALCVALGLLLCGCGTPPAVTPPPPPEYYTPYYADAALRDLQADATDSSATRWGRLNNRYAAQAQHLYEALGVDQWVLSRLPVPDTGWVRIAFSAVGAEKEERFTVYENDLVVAVHPNGNEQRCTAVPGTYAAVVAYLEQVAAEQGRYFSLTEERTDADGHHAAAYTLYDAEGQSVIRKETGSVPATVELMGEGLVRVTDAEGTRLYAPHAARQSVLSKGPAALWDERWAVSDGNRVEVYPLFGTKPLCRLYLAAPADCPVLVQRVDFAADGGALQVVAQDAEGTVYDHTVSLPAESDGAMVRMVGDWRRAMTPATEKEEQVIAYNALKKLRHKEKEAGYSFSAILTGHLTIEQKDHVLCELGHWLVDDNGNVSEYEPLYYLLLPVDLSAAYPVEMAEDELRWNTKENWFKK